MFSPLLYSAYWYVHPRIDAMFEYLNFFIMMDEYMKETVSTKRLVVFLETLAPMKGSPERLPVIASIWHKAVADKGCGSNCIHSQDAQCTSAAYRHMYRAGGVVWLDNYGGQNESYVLFQTLHSVVRTNVIKLDVLTL